MKTKKLLSIFLSMAMLISLFVVPVSADTAPTEKWSDAAAAAFGGGDGTAENPYQIATAEQLAKLAVDVNAGVYGQTHSAEYFILTEDIDLGGKLWTPIGTGTTEGSYHSFDGYFDGNNKTISNMYVDESASGSSAGLFGNMYARGSDNTDVDVDYVVKNLTIKNATVITAGGEYTYAGILAGYASVAYPVNDIKIINCHVSGTVTTTGRAGGLIGSANYITADNCSADAVVTGKGFTGGFVGDLFYPAVSDCTAKGTVNGTWSAGGFAGVITNQLNADTAGVKNCISYADVTASDWNAGGFAGYVGGTDIEKCAAYGDVTSTVTGWPPKLGGFAGSLEPCIGYREGDSSETYYASLTNCYYAGTLTSAHPSILPSGLAAIVTDSTITSSAYDGEKNSGIKGYDAETTPTALSTVETGSEICLNVLGGHNMVDNICTICGCTISFDAGEGSGTMDSAAVNLGDSYTLPNNSFTAPDGKEFKGWEIDGKMYAENGKIDEVKGDVTATAVWVVPAEISIQNTTLYASKAVGYQLDEKITRYWKNGDTGTFTGTADDYNIKIEWSKRDEKDVATITLKGANTADNGNAFSGLTIVAANTFEVDIVVEEDSTMNQFSIYSCDVNITGDGKLTIVDPKKDAQNIYVVGDLTISGANIYAESLEKNAANVIFATNDLIIDDSIVEIKSGSDWTDANYAALRANGAMTIRNGSDVTVTCTDAATCHAVMSMGDMAIEDSTVTVANNGTNRGISSEKDLYIKETNGTTNVTVNSNGIAIAARNGKLSISGGSVTATPATTYAALRADEIEISGGSVTANAVGTYGIYAEVGDITISGDADVSASTETSTAIYAIGNINISENADVKASGKWAIWSKANNIAISGGAVEAISTDYALVSKPDLTSYANPVVFAGEDADSAAIVTDTAGTGYHNLNKYVKIQPGYIITFDANGGTITGVTMVATDSSGKLTALPVVPTYTGYTFNGWFDAAEGGNEITADTVFNADTTVYAQWTVIPKTSGGGGGITRYTVKFETNGGSEVEDKKVTRNFPLEKPAEPTKEGYSFGGWYTDEELTTAYDFEAQVKNDFTLYAKWVEDVKQPDVPDVPDVPQDWKNPFTDVKADDWFYNDVRYANENGLMNGVTGTTFAPNGIITRAMLVTVLYRLEGEPATNKGIPFADVDMGAYYADAVIWAKQNEIVNGVSETEFAPDEPITREQIAAIMYRYAVGDLDMIRIPDYADASEISDYAAQAVAWCKIKGIMQGKENNNFAPQDNATRAEIAAILHRFIEAN